MLHTDKKIDALAIFATGNPDFLKAITEISETVRGMESRLVKMTALQIDTAFDAATSNNSQLDEMRKSAIRFNFEYKTATHHLSADQTIQFARHFLELGYIGGDIVCSVRYNAGINRYIYTFYFD